MFVEVFKLMDRRDCGAVRRCDFMWALSAHGTSTNFQKVLRKSGLSYRFKSTAEDLAPEEFFRLCFPNVSDSDMERMRRWADLRVALFLFEKDGFEGSDDEMRRLFDLLVCEDDGGLALVEILRSKLLTRNELREALPADRELHPLSFEEFCEFLRPALCEKQGICKDTPDHIKTGSTSRQYHRSASRGLEPLPSPPRCRSLRSARARHAFKPPCVPRIPCGMDVDAFSEGARMSTLAVY